MSRSSSGRSRISPPRVAANSVGLRPAEHRPRRRASGEPDRPRRDRSGRRAAARRPRRPAPPARRRSAGRSPRSRSRPAARPAGTRGCRPRPARPTRRTPSSSNAHRATARVAPRPRRGRAPRAPSSSRSRRCRRRGRADEAAGAEQLAGGRVEDRRTGLRCRSPTPAGAALADEGVGVFAQVRARDGGPALDVRILAGPVHGVGVVRPPRAQEQAVCDDLRRAPRGHPAATVRRGHNRIRRARWSVVMSV